MEKNSPRKDTTTTPTIDLHQTLGERFTHILQPGATLTEDEAAEVSIALLHAAQMPMKVWSSEDLEGSAEDHTIEGKADEVADDLWANRSTRLKQLGDCTDTDWQIIADAARDTATSLGIAN